jgi:hypothetical protein
MARAWPSGKATDFDSVIRRFDPSRPNQEERGRPTLDAPSRYDHIFGMTKMDVSKLAAIPFLDHAELQGRFLCSLLFYDGKWLAPG